MFFLSFFFWGVFRPLVFSRSSFLSLRFGGVVGDELLSLLMDLSVVSAQPFFMGNSTGFAPRKICFGVLSVLPLFFGVPLVLARLFGRNFRERTSA